MLILAGVSLNAIIGDNGIISNAQKVSTLSSIANLQEYFQELYVEVNGTDLAEDSSLTPLQTIMNAGYTRYFFHTSEGYCLKKAMPITLEDGTKSTQTYVFYLIYKNQLPKEIQDSVQSSNDVDSRNYRKFKDVYGITSDLKVYYCPDGLDSMIGLTLADINADSPDIIAYDSSTQLAKIINGGSESVTKQKLKSVTSITIDSTEDIAALENFGDLLNLKSVYFYNVTLPNINGISNATNVNYVEFVSCKCLDYSGLCGLNNLTYLYIKMPTRI